ncbi:NFX1-type zinc finger-containing protein 1 [Lobosporangium transversale]|nr:NFX1-type zinc finger-containing protein 1 [Lobosporangium transversale]
MLIFKTNSALTLSSQIAHVGGPSQGFGLGARKAAATWFDEPSPSRQPPQRQPSSPVSQQDRRQYGGSGYSDQRSKPGPNNKQHQMNPRHGAGKKQQQKVNNIPKEEKNLYNDIKKPIPILDDSWKCDFPRSNFRFQSICPTYNDIDADEYPDPPENIIHRGYDSTEQYLHTHFELLRADCILPVRFAIRSYRNGTVDDNDMMMYRNVRPTALLFATIGLVHRMSFVVDGHRVNWRQSKRLIPGTIVCLSTDEFKTYRFATVIERDLQFLENPRELRIGIKFIDSDPMLDFNPDVCYTMIEAMQGYYEAYQHVLRVLQDIDPSTLPFQQQLVELEPELNQPPYSRHIDELWDKEFIEDQISEFPEVMKRDAFKMERKRLDPFEIPSEKPKRREIQPNVVDAMRRMLTKDFAVVQGPPGTGKTFLGLLTTYILLMHTRVADTGPIVIVCQTNHALDQFLEGILKFEENIIRLGSRSKSPLIQPRTLYNVRQQYRENPEEARKAGMGSSAPGRLFKLKNKVESDMLELLEELSVEYVPLAKFLELNIITQEQFDSFAYDGWVTRFDQEENPTAEPWLQAAPPVHDPNAISIFDDALLKEDYVPEIDEEELEERVDEFNVSNLDDTKVTGRNVDMKQSVVCHVDDILVGDITPYLKIPNVHDIPGEKRLGVYKQWLQRYHAHLMRKLGDLHKIFTLICENIRNHFRRNDVTLLKTARVIGMTTTAASKYHDILYLLRPKVMLCEEASETLEAHLMCALTPSVQHFILIGDHQQLRPSMSVHDLKHKNIDVSLFERLVLNGFPFTVLNCQRRMRPEIRNLVSPIYKKLTDHESVHQYDNVRGMVHNLWFLTHEESDSIGANNSHVNIHEAGVACRLAIYLLHQGYDPSEITILTMYSSQRNSIMEKLRQSHTMDAERVRVSTVDAFQGEENEVIILSLVRSNSNNSIGFLRASNRVCVALSRARKGMYIIGNGRMLMEQSKLWQTIVNGLIQGDPSQWKMGNRMKLRCVRHPEVISEVGLESDFDQVQHGGCSKPCQGTFPECGHPCPFQCHAGDHEDMECRQPCGRMLTCGVHFCNQNCGAACKPCNICR